jgi:hypothetical protein
MVSAIEYVKEWGSDRSLGDFEDDWDWDRDYGYDDLGGRDYGYNDYSRRRIGCRLWLCTLARLYSQSGAEQNLKERVPTW